MRTVATRGTPLPASIRDTCFAERPATSACRNPAFNRSAFTASPNRRSADRPSWGLQRKYGELAPRLVFAVTGLRNGVAHNGVVFDTRFQTAKVRGGIPALLKSEIGYAESVQIRFDTITDYLVLLAFLGSGLGLPKREIRELARAFSSATEDLFERVPLNIFSMIVHSDSRSKVQQLESWLRKQ